jgi:hypothetical protein
LYYIVIQGREREGRERGGEGKGEGEGKQAIGKLIDLFIDRYEQTNSPRAANPLLKLLAILRSRSLPYL